MCMVDFVLHFDSEPTHFRFTVQKHTMVPSDSTDLAAFQIGEGCAEK
jgi:hypothetical protein